MQESSAKSNTDTAKGETATEPTTTEDQPKPIVSQATERSVSYTTHTVKSGDTFWGISVQYGIPMPELLKANQMNEHTPLTIGMNINVPVYLIPVKSTPSSEFGELVDWWTEAQYLWPIDRKSVV